MSQDNLIIWQKWADPFGYDDEDHQDNFMDDNQNDMPYSDDKSEAEDDDLNETDVMPLHIKTIPIKVIATPMGIIPMNENTASGKIFNFWIGHTNFNITKKIANILETIDGVETLDIFTRYRFRIGVGKAFNDSNVMRAINNRLYSVLDHVE